MYVYIRHIWWAEEKTRRDTIALQGDAYENRRETSGRPPETATRPGESQHPPIIGLAE